MIFVALVNTLCHPCHGTAPLHPAAFPSLLFSVLVRRPPAPCAPLRPTIRHGFSSSSACVRLISIEWVSCRRLSGRHLSSSTPGTAAAAAARRRPIAPCAPLRPIIAHGLSYSSTRVRMIYVERTKIKRDIPPPHSLLRRLPASPLLSLSPLRRPLAPGAPLRPIITHGFSTSPTCVQWVSTKKRSVHACSPCQTTPRRRLPP